jgi:hypothetical protein
LKRWRGEIFLDETFLKVGGEGIKKRQGERRGEEVFQVFKCPSCKVNSNDERKTGAFVSLHL